MHTRFIHPMHMRHLGRKEHIILSLLLRDFAMSMVEFFVPIFLLIEGYPLYMVGLYYMLEVMTRIFTQLAMPSIFSTIGVQNTLRASYFMSIPYIILLNYIGASDKVFVISAILAGVMHTMFWVSRHIDTASVVSKTKSTSQVGSIEIASSIMRIIAPFAGGAIAQYVSTQATLGVAFGVLISAALVISREAREEVSVKLQKPSISSAITRRNARAFVANIGVNYQIQATAYVWNIYMFLTIDNLGTLGAVLSFGNILYIGTVYTATRVAKPKWFIFAGLMGRIAAMLVRVGARSVVAVAGADTLGATAHGLFLSNYADAYYKNAGTDTDMKASIIATELFGDFGKLILWSLFTWGAVNLSIDDLASLIFITAIPMVGLIYLMFSIKDARVKS